MRIQFLAPKFSKRLSRRSSSSEVHELRRALTSLPRSEEHTSELQSQSNLVCRLLLEKKKKTHYIVTRCKSNTETRDDNRSTGTLCNDLMLNSDDVTARDYMCYISVLDVARSWICSTQ